jgi:hypothetical protein
MAFLEDSLACPLLGNNSNIEIAGDDLQGVGKQWRGAVPKVTVLETPYKDENKRKALIFNDYMIVLYCGDDGLWQVYESAAGARKDSSR